MNVIDVTQMTSRMFSIKDAARWCTKLPGVIKVIMVV